MSYALEKGHESGATTTDGTLGSLQPADPVLR